MALGDVTKDGTTEVIVARQLSLPAAEEGIFSYHPAVFRWKDEEIEYLDAPWTGIPGLGRLSSTAGQTGPTSVFIVDVEGDGWQEVVVGTVPYRSYLALSGLYVFQWDGRAFVAEYSSYCIGGVYRIDPLGINEQGYPRLLLSTTANLNRWRNTSYWPGFKEACPNISEAPDAPLKGLYTFEWKGTSFESTEILTDDAETVLVAQTPIASGTQVFRFPLMKGEDGSVRSLAKEGYVITWPDLRRIPVKDILPLDGYPQQMELGDLDGDGEQELICLLGTSNKRFDPTQLAVFQWKTSGFVQVWRDYADPLRRTVNRMAVGDLDGDGSQEIVTTYGIVYNWTGEGLLHHAGLYRSIEWIGLSDRLYEMAIFDEPTSGNQLWFVSRVPNFGELREGWLFHLFVAQVR